MHGAANATVLKMQVLGYTILAQVHDIMYTIVHDVHMFDIVHERCLIRDVWLEWVYYTILYYTILY